MHLWPFLLFCFLSTQRISGDEEDPLQRAAQLAARERQLTEILNLLENSRPQKIPQQSGSNNLKKNTNDHQACLHKIQKKLKISQKQLNKFDKGKLAALRLANLLNNLFLGRKNDHRYPLHVFYALAREAVEWEKSLVSVGIVFVRDESLKIGRKHDTFGAYAYRWNNRKIVVTDLAALYNYSYDRSNVEGTKWFTQFNYRNFHRPINISEPGNLENTNFVLTKESDGGWFDSPFLDCQASGQWVVAYAAPFFTRNTRDAYTKLRGVVLVTFPLANVDINQCEDNDLIMETNQFGGTDKCDSVSTKCVPAAGHGFQRGGYVCKCRTTHHLLDEDKMYFNGTEIENQFSFQPEKLHRTFECLPCPSGCLHCSGSEICQVKYDTMFRMVPVCIQAVFSALCVVIIISIFKLRKCKVIAAALWMMLEVILVGGIIIYSTIFLRYVEPTAFLCLIEPWVRELGFALFYGAIVLKLYRTLVDHRTRKAHRYVIRDKDLLRYLSGFLVFIACYLAAWAAFSGQLALEGHSILDRGRTYRGLNFVVCRSFWWEYVTEVGELLFILFGLYLAFQLRRAARDTKNVNEILERRALVTSLCLELFFSSIFYAIKHVVWLYIHPDHAFIAYFLRTHVTVTVSLFLILIPKLWCVSGWGNRNASRRTLTSAEGLQELRLCEAIANGEIETANLSQMDPEEIRSELKRVYTQLEELRSRTMRKDNPHISKRRGGRKPTHRRFSLQSRKGSKDKPHNKHFYHHHFDGIEDNKTPEESVCSIEGPSVLSIFADGPSTYSESGHTTSMLYRSYKM